MNIKSTNRLRGKKVQHNKIRLIVIGMFGLLCILVWFNEILDFPHILLGAPFTSFNWQEALIETVVVVIIGFFVVSEIIYYITKHKWAEEGLKESEEKYRTLAENINVGVYRNTLGSAGKFIEANSAIIKMFGYKSKDEFLSMSVADLYQNPGDRKKFNEKMLRHGFVKDEELQLKKKDGTFFMGSVSTVLVKDEKGDVKYYDGIIEDITERKRAEEDIKKAMGKLQTTLEETVNSLAAAVGKRDPYTASHQQRVTKLTIAIAREMGFSKEQVQGIRIAGLLHDIGKISVPAEFLGKPAKLTPAEFTIVKEHSKVGYDILKSIEFPWPIADIVLQHHERINGSGYPQGLLDKDILIEAKILGLADVVEAMCSHRPYRSALGVAKTLKHILQNKGSLFDPEVVDVCVRLFKEKGFRFE